MALRLSVESGYSALPDEKRKDFVYFIQNVLLTSPEAEHKTGLMNNLNVDSPGLLYDLLDLSLAKAHHCRFEFLYTMRHGSWFEMATS